MFRACAAAMGVLLTVVSPCASALTPEALLARLERVLSDIGDYQCRLWEYCWQGSDYEEKTIDFYFKKPRFIRLDVLRSNKPGDAGSQAVYLNDGKVTGRRAGLLSFMSMVFDKHAALVTTIRGVTLDGADMEAVTEKIRRHVDEGTCTLREPPGTYVLVLEPRLTPTRGPVTREIITLDADSLLPLSADTHEGERLVEHAAWTGYILNAGLPVELFDVRWDLGRLSKMGISSVHGMPLPAPR